MEIIKGDKKEEVKVTYEQLKTACDQLHQQNQYLVKELQQKGTEELYKRIDYLFKVVEYKSTFLQTSEEFFNKSVNELIAILTIPEQQEQIKE